VLFFELCKTMVNKVTFLHFRMGNLHPLIRPFRESIGSRNAYHAFNSWNSQIWLGILPVALKYIFVFFYFVVCNCLFTKSIRSHSDIGRMIECFWQYLSLKNFKFLWDLSSVTWAFCSGINPRGGECGNRPFCRRSFCHTSVNVVKYTTSLV